MKIAIADIYPRRGIISNKDLSGGFGTSSDFGGSFLIRLLRFAKGRTVAMPVMSLGYLAAILTGQGHEVGFVTGDAQFAGADLVLVYTSLIAHREEVAFARGVRERARVGFLGPVASVWPHLFLPHGDFIVKGEPEGWARGLKTPELRSLEGVVESPVIDDLDTLPFPRWDIFPYATFSYGVYITKPTFFVLSSRGCPLGCRYYCPYTVMTKGRYRARSVANVLAELKFLKRTYRAKGILFRDPVFTVQRDRTRELCRAMIDERLDLHWACETHLSYLDEDLIDLMREAGLRGLNVGIETVDETVMRDMRRQTARIDAIRRLVDYAERRGVRVGAFYIIGAPPDTRQSIARTLTFAKEINSSYAQFTICTPYPGTEFYAAIEPDIFEKDLEKFDIYTPVFSHPNLSPQELRTLKEQAFIGYYFRPAYIRAMLRRSFMHGFCGR